MGSPSQSETLGELGRPFPCAGVTGHPGAIRSFAPSLTAPSAGVAGLHLFTFDQIAATERWRRALLDRLCG
ncbi:hypothetical protein [Streptomyces vastus]|uniref:Methylenetetrahydrofolate reductase n=1 Tax=Streptomyces vastus TaxID=285451 RepID=A0ABN3QCG7_9ACTN